MSRVVRCRRCGAAFWPDWGDAVGRLTRLCPRCRGPLPPTGGIPFAGGNGYRFRSMEVPA